MPLCGITHTGAWMVLLVVVANIADIGSSYSDLARAIAIQPDGKILVAGVSNVSGSNDFAVVRYNSYGSLDGSFGSGGKVTTDFGSSDNDQAYAIALQSDGKILVAGYSYNSVSSIYDFAVVRYR
ncbi:MAG: delta-60 repeat domain-containing protein [Leptonema sp. (in: bacteria)]